MGFCGWERGVKGKGLVGLYRHDTVPSGFVQLPQSHIVKTVAT